MGLSRRDALKFLGGSAVGVALTPVPWKLLDDTATWSQNWSWIARPPAGEIETRFTTCALCPAGCGVRARAVAGHPVSLAGVPGHPVSAGALCPLAVGGHQLPYHPRRYRQAMFHGAPAPLEAVLGEIRAAAAAGRVAVLDTRPGRAISAAYREFAAALPESSYIAAPSREAATLEAVRALVGAPGPLGVRLDRVRTVVSFGAPVLDGWGTPGRVHAERPHFRLIQAETRQSRTAALADAWLPIRPGTERALALGMAAALAPRAVGFSCERAAAETGIDPAAIREYARMLAGDGPALVLGGGDPGGGPLGCETEAALAFLNVTVGAYGETIVPRRALPGEGTGTRLEEVPDGSLRLLIVDASGSGDALPWTALERKLARGGLTVALAAFPDTLSEHAALVVPVPAWLEALDDVPTPFDAPAATWAVAAPQIPAPAGTVAPVEFLARIGGPAQALEARIEARAGAIFERRRGSLFLATEGRSKPLAELASAAEFRQSLWAGGCWLDDPVAPAAAPRVALPAEAAQSADPPPAAGLAVLPFAWRGATGALPPLLTKLYQESGLRPAASHAWLHPSTAAGCGLADGARAVVETRCGSCTVSVHLDPGAMPGVLHVAAAPGMPPGRAADVLEICEPGDGGTWRVARARVWRA